MKIHIELNSEFRIIPNACRVDSEESYKTLQKLHPSVNFEPYKTEILHGVPAIAKSTLPKISRIGNIFSGPCGVYILSQVGDYEVNLIGLGRCSNRFTNPFPVKNLFNILENEFPTSVRIGDFELIAESITEYIASFRPKQKQLGDYDTDEIVSEIEKRGFMVIKNYS